MNNEKYKLEILHNNGFIDYLIVSEIYPTNKQLCLITYIKSYKCHIWLDHSTIKNVFVINNKKHSKIF